MILFYSRISFVILLIFNIVFWSHDNTGIYAIRINDNPSLFMRENSALIMYFCFICMVISITQIIYPLYLWRINNYAHKIKNIKTYGRNLYLGSVSIIVLSFLLNELDCPFFYWWWEFFQIAIMILFLWANNKHSMSRLSSISVMMVILCFCLKILFFLAGMFSKLAVFEWVAITGGAIGLLECFSLLLLIKQSQGSKRDPIDHAKPSVCNDNE